MAAPAADDVLLGPPTSCTSLEMATVFRTTAWVVRVVEASRVVVAPFAALRMVHRVHPVPNVMAHQIGIILHTSGTRGGPQCTWNVRKELTSGWIGTGRDCPVSGASTVVIVERWVRRVPESLHSLALSIEK